MNRAKKKNNMRENLANEFEDDGKAKKKKNNKHEIITPNQWCSSILHCYIVCVPTYSYSPDRFAVQNT